MSPPDRRRRGTVREWPVGTGTLDP
jgi:hypothetical protein